MPNQPYSLGQRLTAEFIGTGFLLASIIGAGVMAEALSGGNIGVALLGNTFPIGAVLYVLIVALGPISGAHFNPVVTMIAVIRKEQPLSEAVRYVTTQIMGGIVGVLLVHVMFDIEVFQIAQKARTGPAQWVSEVIATFGLIFTILVTLKVKPESVAMSVALYITGAIWFTASTSFANPAVTIARSVSDTFGGIDPAHVPAFILAQIIGGLIALYTCRYMLNEKT